MKCIDHMNKGAFCLRMRENRSVANGGLVLKGVVRFVMVFMKNIWTEFFFDLSEFVLILRR